MRLQEYGFEAIVRSTGLYTEGTTKTETEEKSKCIRESVSIGKSQSIRSTSVTKRSSRAVMLIIAVLFVFLAIAAFYSGLVVRRYSVVTDKLGPGQSIRIVLITDLHSSIYGKNQKDIVSLIEKQKPDMIALAGDIVDEREPIEGTELFLANIKDIAPVYYVTGNHEFWSHKVEPIKDTIRRYGVKILEHEYEHAVINGVPVIIGGVDDPDIRITEGNGYDWIRGMHDAFDSLADEHGFKILLSHRPELMDIYRRFSFDLVLSGHTHGGQVRIPLFLNGLYAPDQGWFPKYAGGLYKHGDMTLIVSRGVSYNPKLPRVFNPPEVTVIDIAGKTKGK